MQNGAYNAASYSWIILAAQSMKNLSSTKWIVFKGLLFLFLGLLSGALLLLDHPTLRAGLLLAVAVWSFCRFYYFVFYVIKRWIDPSYRFSGLLSLGQFLVRRRREGRNS